MDSNNQLINDFNENQIFLTENEFPFAENGFSFATEAIEANASGDVPDDTRPPLGDAETTPLTTPTTTATLETTPAEDALAVVKSEPEEAVEEAEAAAEFTVEAIVGKRRRQNRVEYCVKWLGFAETENTWEPIDNLNCRELIAEYEQLSKTPRPPPRPKRATPQKKETTPPKRRGDGFARGLKPKKVVGVTREAGQLFYSVEWAGQKEAELVAGRVAREKCPQLVIQFLQSKLRFNRKRPREPLENYRPLASKKFSLFSEAKD